MMKINPPFRVEHIGSLLRPRYLKDAWKRYGAAEITGTEYGVIVDRAIKEAVLHQEQLGLGAITDGEFRRKSYWSHFLEAVDGFGTRTAEFKFRDIAGKTQNFLAPYVKQKLRWTGPISGGAFEFLRCATTKTPKLTIPSPPTMHFWCGSDAFDRAVYSNDESFFDDLRELFLKEISDLVARGCTYIQIDDVPLAMLCDENVRSKLASNGRDPDRLTACYMRLINEIICDLPDTVTTGLHLCRGNLKGSWLSEGGYDLIAPRLFGEIEADVFFLEYDDPRAGGFEPLRHLPKNKMVVLGLVTTKSSALEKIDDIKWQLEQAARYVPLENLGISPQCGFSSTVAGNPLTEDDQWRKMDLLVSIAEDVWGDH